MMLVRRQPAVSAARPAVYFDWRDAVCLLVLLALGFAVFGYHSSALPLHMWDESRNANNAVEVLRSGHWLAPPYGGVPDHWNTKPPLLIWAMAGAMWAGVPALLAVRLPVILAAFGTVWLVWAICRHALDDRAAGLVAGLLLLDSMLFGGIHAARTGDYDVPLVFFMTSYVLAFWRAVEPGGAVRMRWFVVACGALVLAVLTKGIAGGFGLIGIGAFVLLTGRVGVLLADGRVWLLATGALVLCVGYYVGRDWVDPGYLQAVGANEFGGRFLVANETHAGGPGYYPRVLLAQFRPGVFVVPLSVVPLIGGETQRRSLTLVCLLCGAGILAVITAAKTKLYWYDLPAVPLLSIPAALGVMDVVRRLRNPLLLRGVLAMGLAAASVLAVYRTQVLLLREAALPENGQSWYGDLFDRLRGTPHVVVVDDGVPNPMGFSDYDPLLRFYAAVARDEGLSVDIAAPGTAAPAVTCEPSLLRGRHLTPWCVSLEPSAVTGQ